MSKKLKFALIALAATIVTVALLSQTSLLRAQSDTGDTAAETSPIFTPAHASLTEAAKHFFDIRPEAVQPIAYTHKPHIEKAKLQCNFCHETVDKGPVATIPGVQKCMVCHEFIATDSPVVQQVIEYNKRGEDIPWQRVYGWNDEAHVRFNHAPHIRAEVPCAKCHGDVAQMNDAKRVVDHTMGFCINCHEQNNASNDCLTCHY